VSSRSIGSVVGGALAVFAGLMIIFSGFSSHGILGATLAYFGSLLPNMPQMIQFPLEVALWGITALIGLGGTVVVFGGILVLYNHRLTGRLLIALGGGMGFIGLIFAILYSLATSGFGSLFTHSEYWLGVLLATVARWLAKK
jgi:hypothetical protein